MEFCGPRVLGGPEILGDGVDEMGREFEVGYL